MERFNRTGRRLSRSAEGNDSVVEGFRRSRFVRGAAAVCVLAALMTVFACCRTLPLNAERTRTVFPFSPEIRVALSLGPRAQAGVRVAAGSVPVGVYEAGGGCILRLSPGESVVVKCRGGRWRFAGSSAVGRSLLSFESTSAAFLKVDGVETAAGLSFSFLNGKPLVTARLGLDEYLAGVLAGEMSDNWPIEALKAQTVAARTYALFRMKTHASRPYDVFADTRSQMFRPAGRYNTVFRSVVAATRGEVLVSPTGKLFPAYYHSTCGGHTVPYHLVFKNDPIPPDSPLGGIRCGYCAKSPYYRWTFLLNKATLTEKLRAAAGRSIPKRPVGKVLRLSFLDGYGTPKRWRKVRIETSNGPLTVSMSTFRGFFGPLDLKSAAVLKVVDHGKTMELQGAGFGHGVGLCQYGARGAALNGLTYKEILRLYYPGTKFFKPYK